jgi:hypothetical protein
VTGLDLTPMVAMVEAEMVDTCRIVAAGTVGDDVLDPVTLELASPTDAQVYEGRCLLSADQGRSAVQDIARDQQTVDLYRLRIPVADDADVQDGAVVVMLTCRWMPSAVGALFTVRTEIIRTLGVSRTFELEERR